MPKIRKRPCPYCGKKLQYPNKLKGRNNMARHLANTCLPYQRELMGICTRILERLFEVIGNPPPRFEDPQAKQKDIDELQRLFTLPSRTVHFRARRDRQTQTQKGALMVNGKLGKLAPRIDKRTLKMSKYIIKPPAPTQESWTAVPAKLFQDPWPMFLNDNLGDCVIAASGHMITEWTANAGKPAMPNDAQILKGYEDVGGYNPADPTTDQGCAMLDALNYWRKTGIAGHQILAYVSIDPLKGAWKGNTWGSAEMMDSIWLFGAAYIGLALPLTAQGQNQWLVDPGGPSGDAAPGTWGGHCVPIVAYNPAGLTVITWGGPMHMSWNFLRWYCDEAYGVLSKDWIGVNGQAPDHFNLAQLEADLISIIS
jgi:hypothetical protein